MSGSENILVFAPLASWRFTLFTGATLGDFLTTRLAGVAVVAALFAPACYRVATPGPARPTVAGASRTMTTLFWGLLQDDDFDDVCARRGALAEVTATTTPLYALATALTLGLWAPLHVETRCLALGANDAKR
jgi:Bor protein